MQEPWWSSQCTLERMKTNAIDLYCPAPSVYGPWAVCLLLQTIVVFFFLHQMAWSVYVWLRSILAVWILLGFMNYFQAAVFDISLCAAQQYLQRHRSPTPASAFSWRADTQILEHALEPDTPIIARHTLLIKPCCDLPSNLVCKLWFIFFPPSLPNPVFGFKFEVWGESVLTLSVLEQMI